jgi:hypothetical protein
VTCTKTGSKNDLFLNCRRKPKELSKKELSNVAPASHAFVKAIRCKKTITACEQEIDVWIIVFNF